MKTKKEDDRVEMGRTVLPVSYFESQVVAAAEVLTEYLRGCEGVDGEVVEMVEAAFYGMTLVRYAYEGQFGLGLEQYNYEMMHTLGRLMWAMDGLRVKERRFERVMFEVGVG